ncbi:MAG: hypothetical protein OXG56_03875 [Gammaproteobacteria bacterium]|nr:hypothetical protein [Gammaproteobacteria bacterium]
MSGHEVFRYQAEMGYSHAELLRELESAVAPYAVRRISESSYSLAAGMHPGGPVAILTLEPESVRRIASIRIPTTRVNIEFRNFDGVEYRNFLDRFRRYLQRGGG